MRQDGVTGVQIHPITQIDSDQNWQQRLYQNALGLDLSEVTANLNHRHHHPLQPSNLPSLRRYPVSYSLVHTEGNAKRLFVIGESQVVPLCLSVFFSLVPNEQNPGVISMWGPIPNSFPPCCYLSVSVSLYLPLPLRRSLYLNLSVVLGPVTHRYRHAVFLFGVWWGECFERATAAPCTAAVALGRLNYSWQSATWDKDKALRMWG